MNNENDPLDEICIETEEPSKKLEEETSISSSSFSQFNSQFDAMQETEEKIRLCIDFMRSSLSQSGIPHFKDFGEGRRRCLVLFKANMNPKLRSGLWAEYVELSSEARRLKEILEEQSAFAVEQIELAIDALEKDLDHYDLLLSNIPEISFPSSCSTLMQKKDFYNLLQRELHLLNTLASRINALRKEVLKTEMRIRFKNKFFERLSSSGDRIFPRRKELIKKISDEFISDVSNFIRMHFDNESDKGLPFYVLREEIKALQGIAKQLTLNTHSFTETRLQLSECWDKIKRKEKDRKKELAQKKQVHKQNFDLAMEKILSLNEIPRSLEHFGEINQKGEEILNFMRELELGREEVKILKDELQKIRKEYLFLNKEKEEERERKEKESSQLRRFKMQEIRKDLQDIIHAKEKSSDELEALRNQHSQDVEQLSLSKAEKLIFDRLFRELKDLINEKKERAILELSQDDLQALEQLKKMLEQRKEQRKEIKVQLESYRKALGESGLDFEKAMVARELLEAEKIRLERANEAIGEIEQKISQIEG